MQEFSELYAQLNDAQRQAVDTTDGPVMVVAGPGTGKTQLLSMRVANILRTTDTLPNNILCLTFTESGATAMRQRLASIIGQDAYKVAIHTFHSFGTEVINHNPEHFYAGARFQPADELSAYELLEPILADLPHRSHLASTMNGEFTMLRDIQTAISHLKRAGITPDELRTILDHNQLFIDFAEPLLAEAFNVPRLSTKILPSFEPLLVALQAFRAKPVGVDLIIPLAQLCTHQLQQALNQARAANSTKPLTAWRNDWLERNSRNQYIFKDRSRAVKLRDLAKVYQNYRKHMDEHELFDFDDMIMRVVHTAETVDELRFNLQEQYLYILVDEFQDTNGAQLRLLHNLTNNPVHEGRPNLMVVGDDDQAIYAFQGAEISNILQFEQLYRQPVIISLTDNYRSVDSVLQAARSVITQGELRLETSLHIAKAPRPHAHHKTAVTHRHSFAAPADQYQWITEHIAERIQAGEAPENFAILARNHKQLLEVLPYLNQAEIPVAYERRNNVLDSPHIMALELLARTVIAMGEQRFELSNAYLPELLSYEFWGIPTQQLWQLSLDAHKQQKFWLEIMLEQGGRLREIAEFLIIASHQALQQPLEHMLDVLIGTQENQAPQDDTDDQGSHIAPVPDELAEANKPEHAQLALWQINTNAREEFVSPFRAYYFNAERLAANANGYLTMLSNLRAIRNHLHEYRPDQPLLLSDFVNFIDLHHKTGLPVTDSAEYRTTSAAIQLMTAHKSKGLEFDTVIILSCQDDIWGNSARSRRGGLAFTHNLPVQPAGDSSDDHLRLFFVAMTRARHNLLLTSYRMNDKGKTSLEVGWLAASPVPQTEHPATNIDQAVILQRNASQSPAPHPDQARQLLAPRLQKYRLSATHLTNFVDVSLGGPQAFLLQNLLRFPQAQSPQAIFGSAVHSALQRAHTHITATGEKRPVEDILHDFEQRLRTGRLDERDFSRLQEKGSDVLQAFLTAAYDSFVPGQRTEYSFGGQDILHGQARLSGAIDLLDINEDTKTITVTDYKTGKPVKSWKGSTDYEKIKLHKYRQQLMFYKLLLDGSREFGGRYTVTKGVVAFVEPDGAGDIHRLELNFDADELAVFSQLIQAVWNRIIQLELPDTTSFDPTYAGILAFEEYLLNQ